MCVGLIAESIAESIAELIVASIAIGRLTPG
jgi:hypothetical protein